MTWLLVALGAAVGAPLRFAVDTWVTGRVARPEGPGLFPWGLLVVNTAGSAVAGLALALTGHEWRVLLISGLCGAFTTFSGFAWGTDRLWPAARAAFWASVIVMPTACVLAFLAASRLVGATV